MISQIKNHKINFDTNILKIINNNKYYIFLKENYIILSIKFNDFRYFLAIITIYEIY